MRSARLGIGIPVGELFLIQLLIAVAACVLIPNFVRARAEGHYAACKSNLKNLSIALEMYAADSQGQYPPRLAALTPTYLRRVPSCPAAETDTYSASYEAHGTHFTVSCQGYNHRLNVAENRPALSESGWLPDQYHPAEASWLEVIVATVVFLGPAWWFLWKQLQNRPTPTLLQAVEFGKQHPWLDRLSAACWVLLCLVCTGAILALFRGYLRWILAPFLGGLLAHALVGFGWWFWGKLSPAPDEKPSSPVLSRAPQVQPPERLTLLPSASQRLQSRVLTVGLPLIWVLTVSAMPWFARGLEAALLGLAAGVLTSFPVYLWTRQFRRQCFERHLEVLPGSGLIYEHSRFWGRPVVRRVGSRADIRELREVDSGWQFQLGDRTYHTDSPP